MFSRMFSLTFCCIFGDGKLIIFDFVILEDPPFANASSPEPLSGNLVGFKITYP